MTNLKLALMVLLSAWVLLNAPAYAQEDDVNVMPVQKHQPEPDNSADNAPVQNEPAEDVAPPPATASQVENQAQRLIAVHLNLYGELLKNRDWIARSMGLISVARLEDPRIIQMMLEIARKDENPIVRVYAWEALHARQDLMDKEQRALWGRLGLELGEKTMLRGDLRLGYLGLMQETGPTERNKKAFAAMFETTNSLNPSDIRTLWAMGDTLKAWQSPDIIKAIINSMSKLDNAYRAEMILQRIDSSIKPSESLRQAGSQEMWNQTQKAWMEWYEADSFKEVPCGQGKPYTALSKMMPRGERITDPNDKKWLKDLEINRFRLNQLDVGFAIDSTGSMGAIVQWIQRDVMKMMKAFEMLSREPRIGVTFYRDVGDRYVVLNLPLTSNSQALAAALRQVDAKGGGDVPESVYDALQALSVQKWSGGKSSRKVILLIGDAPPHKNTLPQIEQLVSQMAKKGFMFYAFKIRTGYASKLNMENYDSELSTFDKIAELGGGESLWVDFNEEKLAANNAGVAEPRDTGKPSPDRVLFKQVISAAMEKDYHDRLEPFLNILIEYLDEPVKETRAPFAPIPPKDPNAKHETPSKPPPPPKDVQQDR